MCPCVCGGGGGGPKGQPIRTPLRPLKGWLAVSGFYEQLLFVISYTFSRLEVPGTPRVWMTQYGCLLNRVFFHFPILELLLNGGTGALPPAAALVAQRLDAPLSPWRREATGARRHSHPNHPQWRLRKREVNVLLFFHLLLRIDASGILITFP